MNQQDLCMPSVMPPYRTVNHLYINTNYIDPKNQFNINTVQNYQPLSFPPINLNQPSPARHSENIFTAPPPTCNVYFNQSGNQLRFPPPANINLPLLPDAQFAQQFGFLHSNQSMPSQSPNNCFRFTAHPNDTPFVNEFLKFPPPDLIQTARFPINKQNPSKDANNSSATIESKDKVFVDSFSNKIQYRTKLENVQIPLKDVASQIKDLQKLEESLFKITNCPQCGVDKQSGENIGNEDTVCYCDSVFAENNLNSNANHKDTELLLKNKMNEIKSVLTEEVIKKSNFKYKKLLKKRERIHRKKEISKKRRQEIIKKSEEWQKSIMAEEKIIKEKLELQRAVERTMSEVKMKIADLNKQLKLFTQLKNLRKIRAERRKKNEMSEEEFNIATKKFDSRSAALEKFINQQLSTYEYEEHTLKVMLDIEAEVDAVTLQRRRKKEEQIRESVYKKQLNEYLFGKKLDIKPEDPMFLFSQHYKMAEKNISNFLSIRAEWDGCIVNNEKQENCSPVMLTYVLPSPPSHDDWAKYLIK